MATAWPHWELDISRDSAGRRVLSLEWNGPKVLDEMKWVESGGTAAANVLLPLTSVCNHAVSKSRPAPPSPFSTGEHDSTTTPPAPPPPAQHPTCYTRLTLTLLCPPLKQPNLVTQCLGVFVREGICWFVNSSC